jgi:hypothetical protein
VQDGFPTDRVELTSREELGNARMVPAAGVDEKLSKYFQQLFPDGREQPAVRSLQQAVLDGHAVIAVHPRGDIEVQRAMDILNRSEPMEMRATDLANQGLEAAAAAKEDSTLAWIGRVLVAPKPPGG